MIVMYFRVIGGCRLNIMKQQHTYLLYNILKATMYEKDTSLFLQIIEYTNLAIIIVFLLLFSYRLYVLRSFSLTDKFQNYFPKLRIFFCLAYVLLSASLIGYNVSTDSYSEKVWYEYVLQGGGGECIDSVILIIQLGVLRLELKKEQPYTKFHIWYFIYLMIMSFARFILTVIDTVHGLNDPANSIISSLMVVDSISQFAYWIKNRQSLPQFINHTSEEIDQSRYQSQILQTRLKMAKRSQHSSLNDYFPYICAFISINHGKIRISLERSSIKNSQILHEDQDRLNQSFLQKESLNQECLSSHQYTIEQIKKLYTICGRFSLKNQLHFNLDIRKFIKELEVFLEYLFSQKKCYTPNILKFLKVSESVIASYQLLLQKLYYVQYKGALDMNTGLQIIDDKNSIYMSLNLYHFMWVYDHYEYYIRINIKEGSVLSYPIKTLQQIQEFYQLLKKNIKIQAKSIDLPPIPKLHSFFARDDELIKQNLNELQLFLRKLVNEQPLMEDSNLRQKILQFGGYEKQAKVVAKYNGDLFNSIKIIKGRISKALIKNEYITLYEFRLQKNGVEIKAISKRFREIDQLHHDLQRWIKTQRFSLGFSLPQKVLYKPQIRHQKLKSYLQNVLELKDLHKCYGALLFFDLGHEQENRQSLLSNNSQKFNPQQRYTFNNTALISDIEIFESLSNLPGGTSRSSNMFSKIIDDLGNQDYD